MLICVLSALTAESVSCLGVQGGDTALYVASAGGHQGVVELLVAKGADVQARDEVSSL